MSSAYRRPLVLIGVLTVAAVGLFVVAVSLPPEFALLVGVLAGLPAAWVLMLTAALIGPHVLGYLSDWLGRHRASRGKTYRGYW